MVFRICKLLGLFLLFIAIGCGEDREVLNPEIVQQDLELNIDRFDLKFDAATPENLAALKEEYPLFFPGPDSIWKAKLEDSLQRVLREEVRTSFEDFEPFKDTLELLFKHIQFYFPEERTPDVLTVTTDVDYRNRVLLADSLLLLGLDNYLGEDHRFYEGIDRYIAAGLSKKYLISDVASAFGSKVIPPPRSRSFVAQMIYYGKILYLKDKIMPWASDAQKIGYTLKELQWAQDNEEQIWRYFIERDLLYSTDRDLAPRFLDPAPFTKFRLELDNESPGRLGRYLGWKIVKSFAQNQDLPVQTLLQLPGEEIFKQSKYKPAR